MKVRFAILRFLEVTLTLLFGIILLIFYLPFLYLGRLFIKKPAPKDRKKHYIPD